LQTYTGHLTRLVLFLPETKKLQNAILINNKDILKEQNTDNKQRHKKTNTHIAQTCTYTCTNQQCHQLTSGKAYELACRIGLVITFINSTSLFRVGCTNNKPEKNYYWQLAEKREH